MRGLFLSALVGLSATLSYGEVWKGEGKTFDLTGKEVKHYGLIVKIEKKEGEKKVEVLAKDKAGKVVWQDTCTEKAAGKNWTKVCTNGTSRGVYLDRGIGHDYYEMKDGKAAATTIVFDGPKKMRLSRTELNAGKAVSMSVDTLQRLR